MHVPPKPYQHAETKQLDLSSTPWMYYPTETPSSSATKGGGKLHGQELALTLVYYIHY